MARTDDEDMDDDDYEDDDDDCEDFNAGPSTASSSTSSLSAVIQHQIQLRHPFLPSIISSGGGAAGGADAASGSGLVDTMVAGATGGGPPQIMYMGSFGAEANASYGIAGESNGLSITSDIGDAFGDNIHYEGVIPESIDNIQISNLDTLHFNQPLDGILSENNDINSYDVGVGQVLVNPGTSASVSASFQPWPIISGVSPQSVATLNYSSVPLNLDHQQPSTSHHNSYQ